MKNKCIHRSPLVLAALISMLLLAVVACGGSGPQELEIPVKLVGDKLDPETIQVGQGDSVTLMIEVEEPGEFHLHGYDIEMDIEPGEPAEFFFVAEATGRFKITYHASGNGAGSHEEDQTHEEPGHDEEGEEVDIGFLEVLPR